jgi:SAM-dependent methyltransferase
MDQKDIILLIKRKKELAGISDSLVLKSLEGYFPNGSLTKLSKADLKLIVKKVRSDLRKYVGQFQISQTKKNKLLLKEDFSELLRIHSSTKERLNIYPAIKELLNKLSVKSILDLGCGINPIAIAESGIFYFATDINNSDLEVVRSFFKKKGISGDVFQSDLTSGKIDFPKADICFMFKILDTIEKNKHHIAESLISGLDCKYLLISFSTKKLSGKVMNFPKRYWLDLMLQRLGLKYRTLKFENEIFYLVDKSSK